MSKNYNVDLEDFNRRVGKDQVGFLVTYNDQTFCTIVKKRDIGKIIEMTSEITTNRINVLADLADYLNSEEFTEEESVYFAKMLPSIFETFVYAEQLEGGHIIIGSCEHLYEMPVFNIDYYLII